MSNPTWDTNSLQNLLLNDGWGRGNFHSWYQLAALLNLGYIQLEEEKVPFLEYPEYDCSVEAEKYKEEAYSQFRDYYSDIKWSAHQWLKSKGFRIIECSRTFAHFITKKGYVQTISGNADYILSAIGNDQFYTVVIHSENEDDDYIALTFRGTDKLNALPEKIYLQNESYMLGQMKFKGIHNVLNEISDALEEIQQEMELVRIDDARRKMDKKIEVYSPEKEMIKESILQEHTTIKEASNFLGSGYDNSRWEKKIKADIKIGNLTAEKVNRVWTIRKNDLLLYKKHHEKEVERSKKTSEDELKKIWSSQNTTDVAILDENSDVLELITLKTANDPCEYYYGNKIIYHEFDMIDRGYRLACLRYANRDGMGKNKHIEKIIGPVIFAGIENRISDKELAQIVSDFGPFNINDKRKRY